MSNQDLPDEVNNILDNEFNDFHEKLVNTRAIADLSRSKSGCKKSKLTSSKGSQQVSDGIIKFMAKHNIENSYQLKLKACLNDRTVGSIIESGSLTTRTAIALGKGVNYKGSDLSIIIRVFRDFEGK